jgi:thiamine kinase
MDIENTLKEYLYSKRLISSDTIWKIQYGGNTNKVWRLTGEKDLICKLFLNTQNNPLFQNNPKAEYQSLLWLDGSGIAPKPYKFLHSPIGDILLYYYIKGPIWNENVIAVSNLLRCVRNYKPPEGLRVLSGLPEDIKKSGFKIIGGLNNYHKSILKGICPDISIVEIEPVLLHTDVVPGNLIFGESGLQLIDWQCPAIGDPIVDIMMFLSPSMHEIYGAGKLSMRDHEIFLMSLSPRLRCRYNKLGVLYHWRLAAYCFWKAEQGALEYENAALAEIDLLKMI